MVVEQADGAGEDGRAPMEADAGAAVPYAQARVMGGGSSVNAMMAIRGLPEDFDGWAAAGADGWGWTDVLPYFRKLEADRDFGGADGHGDAGPLPIRRIDRADWPPVCEAAARALDRILMWNHYVLPLYHDRGQRIAMWSRIARPPAVPVYGLRIDTLWDRTATGR